MSSVSVVWFRNDLRLDANPALSAALRRGEPVLCVFLYENGVNGIRPLGGASQWWLDQSLRSLDDRLQKLGGKLYLRKCDAQHPADILLDVCSKFQTDAVFWNRRYAPCQRIVDEHVKTSLKAAGIEANSFNGSLLDEPWNVKTNDGRLYKVFTPFWKALAAQYERTHPTELPDGVFLSESNDELETWNLHPTKPDWSVGFSQFWTPGELGAQERLEDFLQSDLMGYAEKRDRPDLPATSRLSPHLAFGEISPQQIWSATQAKMEAEPSFEKDGWAFLREVGWRDFSYNLLFQAEDLSRKNWNPRFDEFPWIEDTEKLEAWKKGLTGFPIVDAGLRELWATGWMHNRVRMIVASFLVKHLRIHWWQGEEWFWDTLVDADPANNPASWQWVAGSGADAAPYFRIFNPMTQGDKFDPNGTYVRKWVPELSELPTRFLNQPWEAPKTLLAQHNVTLGRTYPRPIVDHKIARSKALEAYEQTK